MFYIKQYFINYTEKNNGTISDYFINYGINEEGSIVNILKELKAVADTWRDNNDKHYVGWIYDSKNTLNFTKGKFMETVINELYVLKMLSNDNINNLKFRISQSLYRDEIILLYKICTIAGIDINYLLFSSNENNKVRNNVKNRFAVLTKRSLFWDSFENELDYLMINKNKSKLKIVNLNNIYFMLKDVVDFSYVGGVIDEKTYSNFLLMLDNSVNAKKIK